jgi:hypothetical protein
MKLQKENIWKMIYDVRQTFLTSLLVALLCCALLCLLLLLCGGDKFMQTKLCEIQQDE